MTDEYTVIAYFPPINQYELTGISGTKKYCYGEANRMQTAALATDSRTIFLPVRIEIAERLEEEGAGNEE